MSSSQMKASFSVFYHNHKNRYPYNSIKATRRGYICKYVLVLTKEETSEPLFLCTTTCTHEWLLKATTRRSIIPINEDIQHVYEFMCNKGKIICPHWHKECLLYLASIANQLSSSNFNPHRRGIIFQCILKRVQPTLRSLPLSLSQRINILRAWIKQYLLWCRKGSPDMERLVDLSLSFACKASQEHIHR